MTLREIMRWPHGGYWRMVLVTGGFWGSAMFAAEQLGFMGRPSGLIATAAGMAIGGLLFGMAFSAWLWLVTGRFSFQRTPNKSGQG